MANDAGFDAVFVQHGAHLVGRQINVSLAIIALDKTVAIAMARNDAFEFGKKAS